MSRILTLISFVAVLAFASDAFAKTRVFKDAAKFRRHAKIENTSEFDDLPHRNLGNPFTHDGITYTTWQQNRSRKPFGSYLRWPISGRKVLINNSIPDTTLTFGDGGAVTAIGFTMIPQRAAGGEWEIIVVTAKGERHVESFSHGKDQRPHFRGFIDSGGIVAVRVTRPEGRKSPNHGLDDVLRSRVFRLRVPRRR